MQVARVSFLSPAYMKATNLVLKNKYLVTLKRFVEFDTSICKLAMISKGTATSVIEPPEPPWEGDAASTVLGAL